MTELHEWIAASVVQSLDEILDDMRAGIVPMFARDFSTLHDYVDANEYGWLCDTDASTGNIAFPGTEAEWLDAGNVVQDEVHKWLQGNGSQDALLPDARMVWGWSRVEGGDKREFIYSATVSDVRANVFFDDDELIMAVSTTSGRLASLRVDLTSQYAERDHGDVNSRLLFAVGCVEATVADGWL